MRFAGFGSGRLNNIGIDSAFALKTIDIVYRAKTFFEGLL